MALFQSFFAGSGAEDGHPAPVPQKRTELLRLVYRERFWNLLTPNLLYAAFCVPAFLLCAFCLKAVFGYWENGEEVSTGEGYQRDPQRDADAGRDWGKGFKPADDDSDQ